MLTPAQEQNIFEARIRPTAVRPSYVQLANPKFEIIAGMTTAEVRDAAVTAAERSHSATGPTQVISPEKLEAILLAGDRGKGTGERWAHMLVQHAVRVGANIVADPRTPGQANAMLTALADADPQRKYERSVMLLGNPLPEQVQWAMAEYSRSGQIDTVLVPGPENAQVHQVPRPAAVAQRAPAPPVRGVDGRRGVVAGPVAPELVVIGGEASSHATSPGSLPKMLRAAGAPHLIGKPNVQIINAISLRQNIGGSVAHDNEVSNWVTAQAENALQNGRSAIVVTDRHEVAEKVVENLGALGGRYPKSLIQFGHQQATWHPQRGELLGRSGVAIKTIAVNAREAAAAAPRQADPRRVVPPPPQILPSQEVPAGWHAQWPQPSRPEAPAGRLPSFASVVRATGAPISVRDTGAPAKVSLPSIDDMLKGPPVTGRIKRPPERPAQPGVSAVAMRANGDRTLDETAAAATAAASGKRDFSAMSGGSLSAGQARPQKQGRYDDRNRQSDRTR